jgi:dTDP-4-dehydrorhamnose 3,5-epimerase-like enzyme
MFIFVLLIHKYVPLSIYIHIIHIYTHYIGANLAEMSSIGLSVPPGFTVTTEVRTDKHVFVYMYTYVYGYMDKYTYMYTH